MAAYPTHHIPPPSMAAYPTPPHPSPPILSLPIPWQPTPLILSLSLPWQPTPPYPTHALQVRVIQFRVEGTRQGVLHPDLMGFLSKQATRPVYCTLPYVPLSRYYILYNVLQSTYCSLTDTHT